MTPDEHAEAALFDRSQPAIHRFRGAVIVVKYGGNAIGGKDDVASFASDVATLRKEGIRPVVVHGGGPQITDVMRRLGKEPEVRDGLRVTDAETLEIVRMVLVGKVNGEIVRALNAHGVSAIGVSGEDASTLVASPRSADLGFVGDVECVSPDLLRHLLALDLIPVVATIGADRAGQAYNVNADTAASAIAVALSAESLIYLTDVEGVRADPHDPASVVRSLDAAALAALAASGAVGAGMIPKVDGCVSAVRGGVSSAHVLDGRTRHAIVLALSGDAPTGTTVVA